MPRVTRVLVPAAVVAGAVAFLAFALHYVPFYAPSFLAWACITVTLVGLAALVRPLRFLGVPTRARALGVALCGAALAAAAILWPAGVTRAAQTGRRIDRFLPEYQFSEAHEAHVRAPMTAVQRAIREVSLAEMPAAVWLLRIRAAASGRFHTSPPDPRPLLDAMLQPGAGFLALDTAEPGERVYGMVGFVHKPKPPMTTPEQFLAFTEPGGIRVAFDLRAVPESGGFVRLSTETRCLANGDEARRTFARYWRIIYPGSAIIRRVWLDAIIARAERGAPAS